MTRAEHLQWAKARALACLEPPKLAAVESTTARHQEPNTYIAADGQRYQRWPPPVTKKQLADACASILSDLRKHPEIDSSAADMVFAMEAWSGGLNTVEKVKHFINGIN